MPDRPSHGDPRFYALLDRLAELHAKKAADYGTDGKPFANVQAAHGWGIEPWRAALVRFGDKVSRLQTYCQQGRLANEGVEDTLLDAAAYCLIALILHQESQQVLGPSHLQDDDAEANGYSGVLN